MSASETQSAEALTSTGVSLSPRRSRKPVVLLGLFIAVMIFARLAGRMLVSDHPEKSDAIVMLAGDSQDQRYRR